MGISLQWERVLEIAGEAAPGRPHVAEALVEGGFVSNFREAFARYLHNNGPAYAEVMPTVACMLYGAGTKERLCGYV